MEFIKEDLFDAVLTRYYMTHALTLDTADFVDKKDQKDIDKTIARNRKRRLRQVEILYLITLKDKGIKLGLIDKLRIYFSGLEPIYRFEKAEQEKLEKERLKEERAKKKRKQELLAKRKKSRKKKSH